MTWSEIKFIAFIALIRHEAVKTTTKTDSRHNILIVSSVLNALEKLKKLLYCNVAESIKIEWNL